MLYRRPTLRTMRKDLNHRVDAPLEPWDGLPRTSLLQKLVHEFLESTAPVNDDIDDRADDASDTAGVNVFKWRRSETRGVTWPELDPDWIDDDLRRLLGDRDPHVEWLVAVGMRKANAVYDHAANLAKSRKLFPSEKDRDWWQLTAADQVSERILAETPPAFAQALENPGMPVDVELPGGHALQVMIEHNGGLGEWHVGVNRAIVGVDADIIEAILRAGRPALEFDEIQDPSQFPEWADGTWRVFYALE